MDENDRPTIPPDPLISLINAAGNATMLATKKFSNAAAKREDAAYRKLFKYVVGRDPTADELKAMIPS